MMDFKKALFDQFNFTEEDWEITRGYFCIEEIKAKEFFLQEGKISDRIGIIKSGLLRTFFFDQNGDEITSQFFIPGSLVISNVSFNRQVPSRENIIAIDLSELIIFTYNNMQELIKTVPAWQQIPLAASEFKNRQKEKRILELQTLSAKERYLKL